MDPLPLALVLGSALLHATWNLLVKSSIDRLVTAWAQVTAGAMVFLPFLIAADIPSRVLWSVLASGAVHLAYGLLLVESYRHGDLSLVYPVARGSAPIIVTVVAWFLLADQPNPVALIAIGLTAAGVLSVARGSWSVGVTFAVATGVAIASYTLIDAAAVRSLDSALGYTFAVFFSNAVFYTVYVVTRRTIGEIRAVVAVEWRRQLAGGLASTVAYGMVLAAARLAPIGLVSAFRETSVVFGAIGGWLILGESEAKARLGGAGLIAAGLAVLVLFG